MKVSARRFNRKVGYEVTDAVVLVDAYHLRTLGLAMVRNNCTIVQSPSEAHRALSAEGLKLLVVIDSRLETFAEILEEFRGNILKDDGAVTLIVPSEDFLSLYELLEGSTTGEQVSIAGVVFHDELVHVTLVGSETDDQGADPLIAGVLLGARATQPIVRQSKSDDGSGADSEAKLRSLIEAVQKHLSETEAADESRAAIATLAREPQKASDHEIEQLQKQLIDTRTELDSLQRRYDALAGSRLGQITLNHWNRKRRGER